MYRSLFFLCVLFVRLQISSARIKLTVSNFDAGSSASWAGNLSCPRTLLPIKVVIPPKNPFLGPRIGVGYRQGGKSYRNRHSKDAPFVESCGVLT